jgi:uncharacterized protein YbgA (DUF1722 family)/uncharacterized protein YbbK (DUF523 family)
MNDKIKIGISSCLLGENVRYDGGHKLDRFLRDTLGRFVVYVPVCPEVECGLSTPREAMRLVGDPEKPRLVTIRTEKDITRQMLDWSLQKVRELESENLCGFIFKSRSPSSGMERVKVYGKSGMPRKVGVGLFARTFMEHFPLLPTEDEGRLHDAGIRENFIERIFTLKRWRESLAAGESRKNIIGFHTRHKLLIYAHSQKHLREMGKLVADLKGIPLNTAYARYLTLLMEALKLKGTVKKNTNVLQHMAGHFKKVLSSAEKQELVGIIEDYRKGFIPLIVPVTLISHYVRKYDTPYLKDQVYLHPHPLELMLRNHA